MTAPETSRPDTNWRICPACWSEDVATHTRRDGTCPRCANTSGRTEASWAEFADASITHDHGMTSEQHIRDLLMRDDLARCWNCGQRGVPGIATMRICPACDVTWSAVRGHDVPAFSQALFMGEAIPAVDFTVPGALSSPA